MNCNACGMPLYEGHSCYEPSPKFKKGLHQRIAELEAEVERLQDEPSPLFYKMEKEIADLEKENEELKKRVLKYAQYEMDADEKLTKAEDILRQQNEILLVAKNELNHAGFPDNHITIARIIEKTLIYQDYFKEG
jgi:DNA repair exonuclease SbcCD ATPase subunit